VARRKFPKVDGTVEREEFFEDMELVSEEVYAHVQGKATLEAEKFKIAYQDQGGLLTDKTVYELVEKLLLYTQAQSGIPLHKYEQSFARRLIASVLLEDAEEITALFSRQSGKTETIAQVVVALIVILPILAGVFSADPRIEKFKDGVWVGCFGPTYDLIGILYRRMQVRITSQAAKEVLADPEIDIVIPKNKHLNLPNGSFVDAVSAAPGTKIEARTYHIIIIDECLWARSSLRTPEGDRAIKDIVDSRYEGKVRAFDHEQGKDVWTEVLGWVSRPAFEACFELEFENGVVEQCTANHLWWVEGQGYVPAKQLYNLNKSYYNLCVPTKLLEVTHGSDVVGNAVGRRFAKLSGKRIENAAVRHEPFQQADRVCKGKVGTVEDLRRQENHDTSESGLRVRMGKSCNRMQKRIGAVLSTVLSGRQKENPKRVIAAFDSRRAGLVVDGRWEFVKAQKRRLVECARIFNRRSRDHSDLVIGNLGCGVALGDRKKREYAVSGIQAQDVMQVVGSDCELRLPEHEVQDHFRAESSVRRLWGRVRTAEKSAFKSLLLRCLPAGKKNAVRQSASGKEEGFARTNRVPDLRNAVCTQAQEQSVPLLFKSMSEETETGFAAGTTKFVAIRKVPRLKMVYDIKTSTGNFYADGILSHNCQDVSDTKIKASIHPMAAATAGTIVKSGTPIPIGCEFYEACERNKQRDAVLNVPLKYKKYHANHLEYDAHVAAKYNPRYAKFLKKEEIRLGADSDEFRLKYLVQWVASYGRFLTLAQVQQRGVRRGVNLKWKDDAGVARGTFMIRGQTMQSCERTDCVAGIDIGKEKYSTVVTVAKVWWDRPFLYGPEKRYAIHILDWLEIQGDDHEAQYGQILEFLGKFGLMKVVVDATGKGDPVHDRIKAELERVSDIIVIPFVFSTQSKHLGYTLLDQEWKAGRITYPASKQTMHGRARRFVRQMFQLEKSWRGRYMVVQKPNKKDGRDDFPDSLMMACWAVNKDRRRLNRNAFDGRTNPFMMRRGDGRNGLYAGSGGHGLFGQR